MKKQIALFAIVAAALITAPSVVRAEDKPSKPEAGTNAVPHAPKKHGVIPFHGKVASVDAAAATVSVGTLTINITSETKITKNGKPATLSDITVGEKISGSYKKDEAGKLDASSINIGEKGEGKKPKKAEQTEKE